VTPVVSHSTWINALDLLRERQALRSELDRLRAENERLRGALVDEVSAEVLGEHAPAQACASNAGC
jgi:hypothetical protein